VEIDTTVHNPARITKAIGTWVRKGDDLREGPGVEGRPHRQSQILEMPDVLMPVPSEVLERLAALATLPPSPTFSTPEPAPANGNGRKKTREFETFEHTPAGVRGTWNGIVSRCAGRSGTGARHSSV
jgi:hypothetical protein